MPPAQAAVLVQVQLRRPGGRRTLSTKNLHIHTEKPHSAVEKRPLHLEVDLFKTGALAQVRRMDDAFLRYMKRTSIRDPRLRRGTYLIPKELWPDVEKRWEDLCKRRREQIHAFVVDYRRQGTAALINRISLAEEKEHFKEVFRDFFSRNPDFLEALDAYEGDQTPEGKPKLDLATPAPAAEELEGAFSEEFVKRDVLI